MIFKKGARVRLKYKQSVTGTVEETRTSHVFGATFSEYYIRYDQSDLIPPVQWIAEQDVVSINALPTGFSGPKCECGLKYARSGGKHSPWCPMYKP